MTNHKQFLTPAQAERIAIWAVPLIFVALYVFSPVLWPICHISENMYWRREKRLRERMERR